MPFAESVRRLLLADLTCLVAQCLCCLQVQRSDAGLYQCIATNMVGEKVSSPARLSVYEKPYFQVGLDSFFFGGGAQLTSLLKYRVSSIISFQIGNFFTSFPHSSSKAQDPSLKNLPPSDSK